MHIRLRSRLAALLFALPAAAHVAGAQGTTQSAATPLAVAFSGEVRTRSELDHPGGTLAPDFFTYLRTRFGARVDPAPGIRLLFQAQDSRVLGAEGNPAAAVAEGFDLHQAYVELRTPWRGANVALRAGRQEIIIGNERLIGASNWGNLGRSFDGARVTIAHDGTTAGADAWSATTFAATVEERGRHFGTTTNARGVHDHAMAGVSGTITLPRSGAFEGTALYDIGGHFRTFDRSDRATLDLRLRSPRTHGLFAEIETAVQSGTQVDVIDSTRQRAQDVRAWLAAFRVGTAPSNGSATAAPAAHHGSIAIGADLLSGDAMPHDGRYGAFSTMYASNHAFYGLMDVIGDPSSTTRERGLTDVLATGGYTFTPRVAVRAEVHRFLLATGEGRDLGVEGDVTIPFRVFPTATVDVGYSIFRAGHDAAGVGLGISGAIRDWGYLQLRVSF